MNKSVENIKNWLGSGAINIFGMPFSGKDTQGKRLADMLGATFLSSGKILRDSQQVKDTIDKGKLAPTKDFLQIVLPEFSNPKYSGQPLILSSIGRWHGEEQSVIDALSRSQHPLKAVLYLTIPDSEIQARFSALERSDRGNRADDSPAIIEQRLSEFNEKTLPIIDFYKTAGLLIEINGNALRDQVTEEIINKLLAFAEGA